MQFIDDVIDGVVVKRPKINKDDRGWLFEVFRSDDIYPAMYHAMAYLSGTNPLVVRGPHMHEYQSDFFVFIGVGTFHLYLWDNRSQSKTYQHRQRVCCYGPTIVIVPPGVVHAYKNHSENEIGLVINIPDRLYAGLMKAEPVDEVRFENVPDSPFRIEDFPDSGVVGAI